MHCIVLYLNQERKREEGRRGEGGGRRCKIRCFKIRTKLEKNPIDNPPPQELVMIID